MSGDKLLARGIAPSNLSPAFGERGGPRMAPVSSTPKRGIVRFTVVLVAATAILYIVSCFLPATDIGSFDGGALNDGPYVHDPTPGLFHLVFGWLDFPRSLPPWSANFVLSAG